MRSSMVVDWFIGSKFIFVLYELKAIKSLSPNINSETIPEKSLKGTSPDISLYWNYLRAPFGYCLFRDSESGFQANESPVSDHFFLSKRKTGLNLPERRACVVEKCSFWNRPINTMNSENYMIVCKFIRSIFMRYVNDLPLLTNVGFGIEWSLIHVMRLT